MYEASFQIVMGPNVRIQVGFLAKCFSTVNNITAVWPVTCMNSHVCFQIKFKGELLFTHSKGAYKALFSCVNNHVSV